MKKKSTLITSLPTFLNKATQSILRFIGITLFALLPFMLYVALLLFFPPSGIWEKLFAGYVGFKFFLPAELFAIKFITEEL